MGNAIYPTLPGLAFGVSRSPQFSTKVARAVSLSETRGSFAAYPLWGFTLTYEFLRKGQGVAEFEQLLGFFLARKGQFDSFLFTDPDFNSVTNQQFGVGDGVTTSFQLVRSTNLAFSEPVQNPNVISAINDNGSPAGTYTQSNGLISFSVAPAAGHALTWTGTYYNRCRFEQDVADFSKFMQDLWELKTLKLVGSPMNKV